MCRKSDVSGLVSSIQRFCVNDGPGIRTTVFLKGCPLNCIWCHNPETKSPLREIMFDIDRCAGCRACQSVCNESCHTFGEKHFFNREKCKSCGRCAEVCMTQALRVAGEEYTVSEITEELLKDKLFYDNSGGGITLSGGEPFAQFSFTSAVLYEAKRNGLHTCMETCGFATGEQIRQIYPYVDIFLYDYKESNHDLHKEYTGVPDDIILCNLRLLDSLGAKIILRCPIIPGLNDRSDHFMGIAGLANSLENIISIDIEPYHPLGSGKARMLGRNYPLADLGFPSERAVENWISTVCSYTTVPVKKA